MKGTAGIMVLLPNITMSVKNVVKKINEAKKKGKQIDIIETILVVNDEEWQITTDSCDYLYLRYDKGEPEYRLPKGYLVTMFNRQRMDDKLIAAIIHQIIDQKYNGI